MVICMASRSRAELIMQAPFQIKFEPNKTACCERLRRVPFPYVNFDNLDAFPKLANFNRHI
jgi:hypothetical protein